MQSSLELVHNIIDTNQRRSLIDTWNAGDKFFSEVTADDLGIKVEQQDLPYNHPVMKTISGYVSGMKQVSLHQRSSYMLNYGEGSYMRPHTDNDGVHLTCVTLLGASKDLYGGLPFFVDDEDQGKIFSAHVLPIRGI